MQEDQAEIKNAINQVSRAQHELARYQAQYKALHLEYTRLNGVFESQPGIVAQQEVDDAQGQRSGGIVAGRCRPGGSGSGPEPAFCGQGETGS